MKKQQMTMTEAAMKHSSSHAQMRNLLEYLGTRAKLSKKSKGKLITAYNEYTDDLDHQVSYIADLMRNRI
jgi:hypothetical protein